uniref:Secreted protein n=1 Tax=Anopheles atroparvus TaxID=41427 RepID=A0AAG5D7J9_ANOAO
MRTFFSVLCVTIVGLALASPPSMKGGHIPEALDNRLAEMIKWFEARIPIYQKANYLLKKLGVEVAKLSDMHNGIDFYYQGASDLEYFQGGSDMKFKSGDGPQLRVIKVTDGGVDLKPVEEVVRKALEKRNVKNILQLSPEIKSAFKKIMHKKQ